MINLLPEEEKKELQTEKNRRIILILGVLSLIFIVFLTFLLSLLKIYLSSQINFQSELLFNKQKELKFSSQFQDFKQTVKETNQKFAKIRTFYRNQVLIVPILESLSDFVPPSIYFTQLSLQRPGVSEEKSDYLVEIIIRGYARSREDLFLFQKALKENDNFKDVKVSLQSWLEPEDVDFYLTFKVR